MRYLTQSFTLDGALRHGRSVETSLGPLMQQDGSAFAT